MANASTPTLLGLDHFAEILGIDPRHFNQVLCGAFPAVGACKDVWYQFAWQAGGRVAREDLARAIAQAERTIADYVGFWPAPRWTEAEWHLYPRQQRAADNIEIAFFPARSAMRRKTVGADWRYFIRGGRRYVEEIELNVEVVYSDPDDDDFDELATVETSYTNSLDPSEVAVFAGLNTSPENQIRNLLVEVEEDGSITITGQSAEFVLPELWQRREFIDGDESANFLEEVNVYRVYTKYTEEECAPAEFGWQDPTRVLIQGSYGVLQEWDPEAGVVTPIPAVWDDVGGEWDIENFYVINEPHFLRMWYLSGRELDSRCRMSEPWARAVAALATALLTKPVCGCETAERLAGWWQEVPASADAGVWGSFDQLNCPFGPQNGAWEAYKICALEQEHGGASL